MTPKMTGLSKLGLTFFERIGVCDCRDLWSRTRVLDRCWCSFAAFPFCRTEMENMSERTVFLHRPHMLRYLVWNAARSAENTFWLSSDTECSNRLRIFTRTLFVLKGRPPSLDAPPCTLKDKHCHCNCQRLASLFLPQPIWQQHCPTCNGYCGSSTRLTSTFRYPSNTHLVSGVSIFSAPRRASSWRAPYSSVLVCQTTGCSVWPDNRPSFRRFQSLEARPLARTY